MSTEEKSGETSGARSGETSGELNFDSAPGIAERTDVTVGVERIHAATASGLSVVLAVVLVLASFGGAKVLSSRAKASPHGAPHGVPQDAPHGVPRAAVCGLANKAALQLTPSWHAVSLLVMSFLGMNVFFGGLTAFLLNGNTVDAQSYFADISALKLARLSHQHFFGYGLLFGIMALLGLFFVGPNKKRVLFPVLVSFCFGALDVASWWLSRYVSFGFHTLSFITGSMFAMSFLGLYSQIAYINIKAIIAGGSFSKKE